MRVRLLLVGVVLAVLVAVTLRGLSLRAVQQEQVRSCDPPDRYTTLSFTGARLLYHWTVDQLIAERMDLYDGTQLLDCAAAEETGIASLGQTGTLVAMSLEALQDLTSDYGDFSRVLFEHWREYDCYLTYCSSVPGACGLASSFFDVFAHPVSLERIRVRRALDRLLAILRGSEQLLPVDIAVRCTTRLALDFRNTTGLLTDVAACIPARLGAPSTSLRAP